MQTCRRVLITASVVLGWSFCTCSAQQVASKVLVAFDEGGTTFPRVVGRNVWISGTCDPMIRQVVLSGNIAATVPCANGRWESPMLPMEKFSKGEVSIVATVQDARGNRAAATLRFHVVNLLEEGAVGNGTTDDSVAIRAALQKARSLASGIVYAPPGHTYVHSDIIILEGQELVGGGEETVFLATNPLKSTMALKGKRPRLRNLALACNIGDTKRQSSIHSTMVSILEASDFWVDRVAVKGGASAGIFNYGGFGTTEAPGRITANVIADTLADGIHNTHGARHVAVEGNRVRNTGDDCIAVVSYLPQTGSADTRCRHIRIARNDVADSRARGIAVVGGHDVLVADNSIATSRCAGVLVASEEAWKTHGVERVVVRANQITRCSHALAAHAGILLTGSEPHPVSDVRLEGNVIADSPQSAIFLDKHVLRTVIVENKIMGAKHNGIYVLQATDTLVAKNQVQGTGTYGVDVGNESRGFCRVNGNTFTAINTSRKPEVDVIRFWGKSALAAIEASGNTHVRGNDLIDKMVDCPNASALVKDNR